MSDQPQPQQQARPSCGACRYFLRSGDEPKGECRRFPPRAFPTGFSAFPSTHQRGWCGEHQAGEPEVSTKVKPETPEQAARARAQQARQPRR